MSIYDGISHYDVSANNWWMEHTFKRKYKGKKYNNKLKYYDIMSIEVRNSNKYYYDLYFTGLISRHFYINSQDAEYVLRKIGMYKFIELNKDKIEYDNICYYCNDETHYYKIKNNTLILECANCFCSWKVSPIKVCKLKN